MATDLNKQLLGVNLKPFNENKIKEALESFIFECIDLTPLFNNLINKS